jgi:toxin ParE1/3/4
MRDLKEIRAYLASQSPPAEADRIVDRLIDAAGELRHFPDRGAVPPELAELGEQKYRQISSPPYRIIYERSDKLVRIYLVALAKRDMQTLLRLRLLRS